MITRRGFLKGSLVAVVASSLPIVLPKRAAAAKEQWYFDAELGILRNPGMTKNLFREAREMSIQSRWSPAAYELRAKQGSIRKHAESADIRRRLRRHAAWYIARGRNAEIRMGLPQNYGRRSYIMLVPLDAQGRCTL